MEDESGWGTFLVPREYEQQARDILEAYDDGEDVDDEYIDLMERFRISSIKEYYFENPEPMA
jgi:hypothetical protein